MFLYDFLSMLIICQVGNKPTQTEELKVEKKAITAFSLYFLLQFDSIHVAY